MRIAFLCTSGLDNASPRGRWLPVARELAKHGHEPHLLLLHPTFDCVTARERQFSCDGVHIVNASQMHVYGLPGERRYFGPAELAIVSLRAALSLARRAIQLKPDIIHICKPQPINGLAGWIASRALGRPFFVDCDDYEAEANRVSSEWQRRLIRWWEDNLPRHAAGVTVNTRFLQERCHAIGVPADRIAYVPNGANPPASLSLDGLPADLLALQDQPTVIYVGTLSTVSHGVDLLLDAFALVLKQLPDARLLIVGDGDERVTLQAQARQLGIMRATHWVGRVPPEETSRYFSLAICSVDPVYDTPAIRGRSPLKIVESLAAGVPVVTSDVGDRRETIGLGDDTAGILVKPGDAAALAEGLSAVWRDPARQAQLRAGASRQSHHFCWDRLATYWANVYLPHPGRSS